MVSAINATHCINQHIYCFSGLSQNTLHKTIHWILKMAHLFFSRCNNIIFFSIHNALVVQPSCIYLIYVVFIESQTTCPQAVYINLPGMTCKPVLGFLVRLIMLIFMVQSSLRIHEWINIPWWDTCDYTFCGIWHSCTIIRLFFIPYFIIAECLWLGHAQSHPLYCL